MTTLVILGLGSLLLAGAILALVRSKRLGPAMQFLGAGLLVASCVLRIVFGPGCVIVDLPDSSAGQQMRRAEILGMIGFVGLLLFAVAYFFTEVQAFKRRNVQMK